jgi:hypothetical protein
MRSKILPLVLIASMSFGAVAFAAATDTKGVVKAIDEKTMTLTLEDGSVYKLPAGFKLADLKVGEKVTVSWEAKGADKDASAVKADK